MARNETTKSVIDLPHWPTRFDTFFSENAVHVNAFWYGLVGGITIVIQFSRVD